MKVKSVLYTLIYLTGLVSTSVSANIIGTANSNNCFPFGCYYGWMPEYQQIYASSEFSGVTSIESLTFYNTTYDSGDYSSNSGNYTISLTTTSKSVDGLSSVASDNYGSDMMTVFTGSIYNNHGFGGSFDIIFNNIFSYDASAGNLLMVVTATGLSNSGNTYYDSDEGGANTSSRFFGGSVTNTWALVTGFNVAAPDPGQINANSPGVFLLFGLAMSGFALLRNRAK